MADELNDSGFWQRFWSRITGNNKLGKGDKVGDVSGYSTPSGTEVNSDTALKISTVWACIRIKSEIISSLPLHLLDKEKQIAKDHPIYRIIHDQPNADMTAIEFWQAMVASLDISGNAYAEIVRNSRSEIISLHILYAEDVTVHRLQNGSIEYIHKEGGKERRLRDDDVFHIKGFTLDGLTGLSPIRYAGETIGGQLESNSAALHEFKNRLNIGGIIEYQQGTLQPEQRERLREMLRKYRQPEHAGEFLVLEKGLNLSASSSHLKLNPTDVQLLESRMFGIEEICRAFGVPPQLIGHTDKASSWASSLDGANMGFLTYTLRPILVKIEQAIIKKLLKVNERKLFTPTFKVEGLLRSNTRERSEFYVSMLANGVMTTNEVRELEDLPPVEGGDELRVQLNMTKLTNLGRESEKE